MSLEGIDQTGKTEFVDSIVDALERKGMRVHPVTDPPRLPPWDDLKRQYFDEENELSGVAEAWLFLTARLDMVQREIIPALAEDAFVVADRYVDSWVAYHAPRLRRNLGSTEAAVGFLTRVQEDLSRSRLLPFPNRTWFIRDRPEVALRRKKGPRSKWEKLDVQRVVAESYELLLKGSHGRVRIVDTGGRTLDDVRDRLVPDVVRYCVREENTA